MKFNMKRAVATIAAIMMLGSGLAFGAKRATRPVPTLTDAELSAKVGNELIDMPFFTVFDNLQYRVNGGEVTLYGQTANPTLRADAASFVRSIPSVTKVNNEIELLPESPFDSRIRRAEFRAIYSAPLLQKYGVGTNPSIHIIVKSGHVTLMGEVNNQADKHMAGTRALQVGTALSVDNQLKVK